MHRIHRFPIISSKPGYLAVFKKTAVWIIGFCILCGIAAFFGADTVQINGKYIYGFYALTTSTFLAIPLAALIAFPIWFIMWFSYWLAAAFTFMTRRKSAERGATANP